MILIFTIFSSFNFIAQSASASPPATGDKAFANASVSYSTLNNVNSGTNQVTLSSSGFAYFSYDTNYYGVTRIDVTTKQVVDVNITTSGYGYQTAITSSSNMYVFVSGMSSVFVVGLSNMTYWKDISGVASQTSGLIIVNSNIWLVNGGGIDIIGLSNNTYWKTLSGVNGLSDVLYNGNVYAFGSGSNPTAIGASNFTEWIPTATGSFPGTGDSPAYLVGSITYLTELGGTLYKVWMNNLTASSSLIGQSDNNIPSQVVVTPSNVYVASDYNPDLYVVGVSNWTWWKTVTFQSGISPTGLTASSWLGFLI